MPTGLAAELLVGVGRADVDRWPDDVVVAGLAEVGGRAEAVPPRALLLADAGVALDEVCGVTAALADEDVVAAADAPVAVDDSGAAVEVALHAAHAARNAVPETVNTPRRLN